MDVVHGEQQDRQHREPEEALAADGHQGRHVGGADEALLDDHLTGDDHLGGDDQRVTWINTREGGVLRRGMLQFGDVLFDFDENHGSLAVLKKSGFRREYLHFIHYLLFVLANCSFFLVNVKK